MILLGLTWGCTGGCVEYRYWFLPVADHGDDYRPYLRAEVVTRGAPRGVPLVYQSYTPRPPFGLRLTFLTHSVVPEPTLALDVATLEFPDGAVADLRPRLRQRLVPAESDHIYVDGGGKEQTRPSLRWEGFVDGCVPSPTPLRVRLKGQLRSAGAAVEEFDVILSIPLYFHSGAVTGWEWMMADSV
jgi:hypothetical protein